MGEAAARPIGQPDRVQRLPGEILCGLHKDASLHVLCQVGGDQQWHHTLPENQETRVSTF